ncbi:MAG: DUF72 domain-containing protein [Chloroflexi bacterium]|nr:DUF72 domain-containing protein [Chloroflexota bacterium]
MTTWYLGTMGFSYKDWEGVFYPPQTSSRDYLAHYSRIFNAVELDSTFYGTPPTSTVERWAAVTPQDFKFAAKVPQKITHELQLSHAWEEMQAFLATMRLLGDKLGPILIQLPPSFDVSRLATLADFLGTLPGDIRYAVEFRDRSWYIPEVGEVLSSHRIAWASTDYGDLPRHIEPVTNFLYIRWIGQHGRFAHHDREGLDLTPQLKWWQDRLRPYAGKVEAIYGFFNNDYAGHSPATCNTFKRIIGLPVEEYIPPRQGTLF